MSSLKLDDHAAAVIARALKSKDGRDLKPYPLEGGEEARKAWLDESIKRNDQALKQHKRIHTILKAMTDLFEE